LWLSLYEQARARRFSRHAGQRLDSLAALAKAAQLRKDDRLRDEAIAAMALPDVRLGPTWHGLPPGFPRWHRLAPDSQFWAVDAHYRRYRARQFEQAIKRLEPHTRCPEYEIVTALFLAMAHQGLGQSDEARRWLDKAVQIMDQEMAAKEIGPHRRQCQSWAANQVLRGEAEEMLKK
jgi:hypothetical protein